MGKKTEARQIRRESVFRTKQGYIELGLAELKDEGGSFPPETIQWINDEFHSPKSPLSRLFKAAGLSPGRNDHWMLLLQMFAESYYGETRGAKKYRWDEGRKERFLLAASAAKTELKQRGEKTTRQNICKKLSVGTEFARSTGRYVNKKKEIETLVTNLSRILKNTETKLRLPSERQEYEFVPHRLEALLSAMRNLKSR